MIAYVSAGKTVLQVEYCPEYHIVDVLGVDQIDVDGLYIKRGDDFVLLSEVLANKAYLKYAEALKNGDIEYVDERKAGF